jgi:hypothetical protein
VLLRDPNFSLKKHTSGSLKVCPYLESIFPSSNEDFRKYRTTRTQAVGPSISPTTDKVRPCSPEGETTLKRISVSKIRRILQDKEGNFLGSDGGISQSELLREHKLRTRIWDCKLVNTNLWGLPIPGEKPATRGNCFEVL